MSARGFLGAGDVYLDLIVGGVPTGLVGPFESTKLEIKPNVDLKEQVSKGKTTYGQVIESVAIPQPADFTLELAEVNKTTVAQALLGTTEGFTQASGTVTDEVMAAKTGIWVPVAKHSISNVVLTNSGASTTYIKGTDYLVNEDMGWVKALAGGAITDAQSLKIDYSYAAKAGSLIRGATKADLRVRVVMDGKNQVDGLNCRLTVHELVIAADSAFDFLADDFNSVSLPGRMKTPSGYTEPFTVHMFDN